MKMQGKVALVTGAALGYKAGGPSIGSGIAFKLASEGAKVVGSYTGRFLRRVL